MIAQLGNIKFEVLDLQEGMHIQQKYMYKEHDVLKGKSQLQYTGEGLKTLSLKLSLNHYFCDPDAKIRELQDEAAKHNAMSLVMGNGKYYGDYVIETLDIQLTNTDPRGNIISVMVSVQLKEHAARGTNGRKEPSNNGKTPQRNNPNKDSKPADLNAQAGQKV